MKILLIRLRLIGDVVFTTPAIRALHELVPSAELTYIVEQESAPVLASNPYIHDLIVIPRARGLARWQHDLRLARRLRHRRFDIAIDFHGGPRSSWLTLGSGAKLRVGYRVTGRSWIYTRVVDRPRELRRRHSVENQWDLVQAAFPDRLSADDARKFPVEMPEHADAAASVAGKLASLGVGPSDHLVVIHVSAGNPFRRWPLEAFAHVTAQLVSEAPNRRIILTAGPSDREAAARVSVMAREHLTPAHHPAVINCDNVSLAELRSLIGAASLFIGGDSGPLHMAATTGVPIVGLYGPTLPERSAPWRDERSVTESVDAGALPCRPCEQRQCVPGDFRCLTSIDPSHVIAAAERAMAREDARHASPREDEAHLKEVWP